jgi:hypothetical protein
LGGQQGPGLFRFNSSQMIRQQCLGHKQTFSRGILP